MSELDLTDTLLSLLGIIRDKIGETNVKTIEDDISMNVDESQSSSDKVIIKF